MIKNTPIAGILFIAIWFGLTNKARASHSRCSPFKDTIKEGSTYKCCGLLFAIDADLPAESVEVTECTPHQCVFEQLNEPPKPPKYFFRTGLSPPQ